jgi:hypothetical protein
MVAQPEMNNYLADRGYLKCSAQGSSLRNEPGTLFRKRPVILYARRLRG